MPSVDLACIIYVDVHKDELVDRLNHQMLAKDTCNSVFYAQYNEIEFLNNLDYDPISSQQFPDGFLHFQQRIEIFPDESKSVSLENQIELVSMILKILWSQDIPAIAACDYEENLPNNGGYKSNRVPWVKPKS
jgi:hypothetical protein